MSLNIRKYVGNKTGKEKLYEREKHSGYLWLPAEKRLDQKPFLVHSGAAGSAFLYVVPL